MDLLQNSPTNNQIYNRRSYQPATFNYHMHNNNQQINNYDSHLNESYEQGQVEYPPMMVTNNNKLRNSYQEEILKKPNILPKYLPHSNMDNKLGVVPMFINELGKELDNLTNSNNSTAAEIEKIELNHSDLIASRIKLVEEIIEKKTNLILLKKEVEVKRGYLNSLIRIKKTETEEIQKSKISRLNKQIENINESTDILNVAAGYLKNTHGLNLKFLDEINKEILINLIRKS